MSAPYLQDNARSAYVARSSGKAAGCASTSVPGAMAPLTDHPPEGYTRYRAPSAPDERLSRTRGSPDRDGLATWDTTRAGPSDGAVSG